MFVLFVLFYFYHFPFYLYFYLLLLFIIFILFIVFYFLKFLKKLKRWRRKNFLQKPKLRNILFFDLYNYDKINHILLLNYSFWKIYGFWKIFKTFLNSTFCRFIFFFFEDLKNIKIKYKNKIKQNKWFINKNKTRNNINNKQNEYLFRRNFNAK